MRKDFGYGWRAEKRKAPNGFWEFILNAIVIIIATLLVAWAFNFAFQKQDEIDCQKWQNWETEYYHFEPSADMISKCEALGIDLIK